MKFYLSFYLEQEVILFYNVKTVFFNTYFFLSFCPISVLIRFVVMLALNMWVTATVLHYRKTIFKAE